MNFLSFFSRSSSSSLCLYINSKRVHSVLHSRRSHGAKIMSNESREIQESELTIHGFYEQTLVDPHALLHYTLALLSSGAIGFNIIFSNAFLPRTFMLNIPTHFLSNTHTDTDTAKCLVCTALRHSSNISTIKLQNRFTTSNISTVKGMCEISLATVLVSSSNALAQFYIFSNTQFCMKIQSQVHS